MFDLSWASFEKYYVLELMIIEADARRFIIESIALEKTLAEEEQKEKQRRKIIMGSKSIEQIREKLVKLICQINSVANNTEGTGRDDLGHEILKAAEAITRRVSLA